MTPLVFLVVESAAVTVSMAAATAAMVTIVPISDRSAMNVCSR